MRESSLPRVVFVAPGFSEPGGCASHGRKIAEGLAERGWEVSVVGRLASGNRLIRQRGLRLHIVEVPGFGHRCVGAFLFLLVAFPLAVVRRRPTAFLAMQLSSPATVAVAASIVHRRPVLVLSTLTGDNGEVAFVRSSRLRSLRLALLRRASALVGQTDEAAEELASLLPRQRIAVVPTPIRVSGNPPPLSGAPRATYSGRLVRQKNLTTLLAAWHRVLAELPDAQLWLVGTGIDGDPTAAELEERINSDTALRASVTITGWVDDASAYVKHSDVYVLPSHSEGMSNGLLEAAVLGRVIVASDIAANRAVLGDDYPLLADPDDEEQFRSALIAALTDMALRSQAREQILQRLSRFDITSVLDDIEELLPA